MFGKIAATKQLLFIAGFFAFVFSQRVFAEEQINLALGEESVLDLPSIAKSVDLGSASVVKVRKGSTKAMLIVKGSVMGETHCTITLADGNEIRYKFVVGNTLANIKRALSKIESIKYEEQDGRVYISGNIGNRQAQIQLREIKQRYPGLIVDGTEQDLASSNTVVSTINRILKENDLANIQAHAYGKMIVLEGSPKDEQQADLAMKIAGMINPGTENRLSKNSKGAPSISIEVMFIEVNKGNVLKAGFNQTGQGNNMGLMSAAVAQKNISIPSNPSIYWQVGGLSTFLELIQTKTSSRVLSNPKLIARSGEEAKFNAGHILYLTRNTVQEAQVVTEIFPITSGIELKIVPKLDPLGQIDTSILASVSEPAEVKDESSPDYSISKVETSVTINDGQTILLGGMVSKKENKTVDRVPLLADIPLVGELFKHRQKHEDETEMLVLVTMNRVHGQDEKLKATGQEIWDKSAADVEFNISD